MTAALALLLFAAVTATLGRPLLIRARWPERSPRAGIWAWQALTIAVAAAVGLAGLAVALPLLPLSDQLAQLVSVDPIEIAEHYNTPGGTAAALLALVATMALTLRFTWFLGGSMVRAGRHRRGQRDTLALLGARESSGYTLLEHATPAVYCLPGRGRQVVVTTGAVALLSPHELELVLAHEQTHLRARHDLALAATHALARTFDPMRLFQTAHEQITTLVEMQADDAVKAVGDRRSLARALLRMTSAAACGSSTASLSRARRLTSPCGPMSLANSTFVGLATAVVLTFPVALALTPALEAAARDCCVPATLTSLVH